MFERLAGKLLSRLLSKYFEQHNPANDSTTGANTETSTGSTISSTQLGVWSGYVSLENLVLKQEFVNEFFHNKGLPFELLSCSLQRVEITIPWGKLGAGLGSSDASVVVVIDGVHILLTTNYEFHDDVIEKSRLTRRRTQLSESESFVRQNCNPQDMVDVNDDHDQETNPSNSNNFNKKQQSSSSFAGISGFLKKRLTEGIFNDIIDKFHLHLRNVHIRLEDVNTDVSNPFACGVTLESLHIHSDDETTSNSTKTNISNIISSDDIKPPMESVHKVMQLNCLAVYWNSIKNEPHAPTTSAMFHKLEKNSSSMFGAMHDCIIRRSDNSVSGSNRSYPRLPHACILLPMNATCHTFLAKDSDNLQSGPALKVSMIVETFAVELQDNQFRQILILIPAIQNHKEIQKYRQYRPKVSVMQCPKVWWIYAMKAIKMRLREKETRWSLHRFSERSSLRKEYCGLYERLIIAGIQGKSTMKRILSTPVVTQTRLEPHMTSNSDMKRILSTPNKLLSDLEQSNYNKAEQNEISESTALSHLDEENVIALNSANENPTTTILKPLDMFELETIQSIEDGTKGDLTVHDIITFRAMVHANLVTKTKVFQTNDPSAFSKGGKFSTFIRKMIIDDTDAEEEYNGLLAFLENSSKKECTQNDEMKRAFVALSLQVLFEKGSVTLLSRIPVVKSNINSHFTQKEGAKPFLELSFSSLCAKYALFGDYDSFKVSISLESCEGSEIFSNGSRNILFAGIKPSLLETNEKNGEYENQVDSRANDKILDFQLESNPGDENRMFDILISGKIEKLEFFLRPTAMWHKHIKSIFLSFPTQANSQEYWENLRMAYINSWNSAKAGFRAKMSLALFQHKAVGFDFHIDAPIISINDDNGTTLLLDLGKLDISTKQLAKFTSKSVQMESFLEDGEIKQTDQSSLFIEPNSSFLEKLGDDDSLKQTPAKDERIPSMTFIPSFYGGSGQKWLRDDISQSTGTVNSFERRGRRRSRGQSIALSEGDLSTAHTHKTSKRAKSSKNLWKSCFYDIFQVRVCETCVYFQVHGSNQLAGPRVSILHDVDMKITLEKSIIPADHTLSRIKAKCVVENLHFSFPTSSFAHFGNILGSWNAMSSQTGNNGKYQYGKITDQGTPNIYKASTQMGDLRYELDSKCSDDLEFLDALDEEDLEDDASAWFDENWVLGLEDNTFAETNCMSEEEISHQRRLFNDLSSRSDRTRLSSRQKLLSPTTYLSAENLARLDESCSEGNITQEISASESALSQISVESFHSAMSLGDHVDLTYALQNDIKTAEEEVKHLKDDIQQIIQNNKEKWSQGRSLSSEERTVQIQLKKELKIELLRAEAELRALRASYHEIMIQLATAKYYNYSNILEGHDINSTISKEEDKRGYQRSASIDLQTNDSSQHTAILARSLLKARSIKGSTKPNFYSQHNLTSRLNRDKFFCSLVIKSITLEITENEEEPNFLQAMTNSESTCAQIFKISLSELNMSLHLREFDSRISFALKAACVSDQISESFGHTNATFFHGKGTESSEKFVRLAVETSKRQNQGENTLRMKVAIGTIESCIEQSTITRIFSITKFVKSNLSRKSTDSPIQKDQSSTEASLFWDRFHSKVMNSRTLIQKSSDENPTRESNFNKVNVSFAIDTCKFDLYDCNDQLITSQIDGLKIRCARTLSPLVIHNRGQIDIRISDLKLIEYCKEKNPYSITVIGKQVDTKSITPLLHVNCKIQLVPASQCSGWTVGGQHFDADKISITDPLVGDLVWNVHVGTTCQSLNTNLSFSAVNKIRYLLEHLRNDSNENESALAHHNSKPNNESITLNMDNDFRPESYASEQDDIMTTFGTRWRIDFVMKKSRYILPNNDSNEKSMKEASLFIVCDVTHLCIQSNANRNNSDVKFNIENLSAFRNIDNWLLLEPTTFRFDGSQQLEIKNDSSPLFHQLEMPLTSRWNFVAQNEIFHPILSSASHDINFIISASFSPIHINISSKVLALIVCSMDSFSNPGWDRKSNSLQTDECQEKNKDETLSHLPLIKNSIHSMITLPSINLHLKKETKLTSSSYRTDPIGLLMMESFTLTVSNTAETMSMDMQIKYFSIFDLSCLPTIRIFGPQTLTASESYTQLSLLLTIEKNQDPMQDYFTAHLVMRFGECQCLISPPFFAKVFQIERDVHKLLKVQRNFPEELNQSNPSKKNYSTLINALSTPSRLRFIQLTLNSDGFEIILPTRDVSINLSKDVPINVVAIRWASSFDINVCLCPGNEIMTEDSSDTGFPFLDRIVSDREKTNLLDKPIFDPHEPEASAFELWEDWKKHHHRQKQSSPDTVQNEFPIRSPKLNSLLALIIKLEVSNFQMIRTCITQNRRSRFAMTPIPRQNSTVPDSSSWQKNESQCTFVVTPPLAGEQQIISPVNFYVKYSASATSFHLSLPPLIPHPMETSMLGNINFSHAIQIEVGFIDAMIYIRQSSEGFTEALKVSVYPLIDIVKKGSKTQEKPNVKENDHNMQSKVMRRNVHSQMKLSTSPSSISSFPTQSLPPSNHMDDINLDTSDSLLLSILRRSTMIISVCAGGIQVTYVPGGATRLTEAPIMKCSATALKLGGTVISAPNISGYNEENPTDVAISSLHGASWISCEISAHYHNRRLVAWEPLVERWALSCRLGANLSELFQLRYRRWIDSSPISMQSGSLASPLEALVDNHPGAWNSNRMRDIGRRLLSMNGLQDDKDDFRKQTDSDFLSRHIAESLKCTSDLSQLLLHFLSPCCLKLSLYEPDGSDHQGTIFPSGEQYLWLRLHGYPPTLELKRNQNQEQTLLVAIRDSNPLNINMTSAFIENLSGFLSNKNSFKNPSPHLIRNNCGLPIRYIEDLDLQRIEKGEKAESIFLANGDELSLSLKRGVSQTCDPHQAYIYIEIDHYSSVIDKKVDEKKHDFKSSAQNYYFRAAGRIPVDMVGVYEFSLQRADNSHRNSLHKNNILSHLNTFKDVGVIIARVALIGGAKVVSIESPLMIKNTSDTILSCMLRDKTGHLYWGANIYPKNCYDKNRKTQLNSKFSIPNCVPVPPFFIPSESVGFLSLSICAISNAHADSQINLNLDSTDHTHAIRFPHPFSKTSTGRGIIKESDLKMTVPQNHSSSQKSESSSSHVHVNLCSLRIGTFSDLETIDVKIPEQRMILIRSPFAIRNHLPVSIFVQVRREQSEYSLEETTFANDDYVTWENFGVLKCGATASWSGVHSSDSVEFRIRLVDEDSMGSESSGFPSFSSPIVIPSKNDIANMKMEETFSSNAKYSANDAFMLETVVIDKHGTPLTLSVSLEEDFIGNKSDNDLATQDDISCYASLVPSAARVVAIHVPFWIVDETGMDIEFKSELAIGGQMHKDVIDIEGNFQKSNQLALSEGLSGVLRDTNMDLRSPFLVHMIGDAKATKLSMRRHVLKSHEGSNRKDFVLPWSDPIPLKSQVSMHRVSVHLPYAMQKEGLLNEFVLSMALNCRIKPAPELFGGKHGTRLIHVVNRYILLNNLGRDLEVKTDDRKDVGFSTISLLADAKIPFHFDDSGLVRIRPKEYGWGWSGAFTLKKKRRETFVRVRNKLTGSTIIVNIEFQQTSEVSGTTLVSFQPVTRPPFIVENETLHPIQFYQETRRFSGSYKASHDPVIDVLLPYHSAPYCWDEPDDTSRSLIIEMADFGLDQTILQSPTLGNFHLDQLAPGFTLQLNKRFALDIVADGPTRVVRVSDSTLPKASSESEGVKVVLNRDDTSEYLSRRFNHPHHIDIKLTHGLGISVVDAEPKELLYLRLEDLSLDRFVTSGGTEVMEFSVGNISIDNQLWITPYPVLLKLGSRITKNKNALRRRKRKKTAASISWCRDKDFSGAQDGLTLLRSVDIALEPMIIRVDGNLTDQLIEMYLSAMRIEGNAFDTNKDLECWPIASRDDELILALGGGKDRAFLNKQGTSYDSKISSANDIVSFIESTGLVITAAMAAKSHAKESKMSHHNIDIGNGMSPDKLVESKSKDNLASTPTMSNSSQKKVYIENLRISSIKVELSWSGPLPAFFNLPTFLRPALTIEGFPIMLRPYSIDHAYDTAKDHLQSLKTHYINIGRIFDLIMGLVFKPGLILRATIYTSRYYTSSSLETFSHFLSSNRKKLLALVNSEEQPTRSFNMSKNTYISTLSTRAPRYISTPFNILLGNFTFSAIGRGVKWTASFLRVCSNMMLTAASIFSYKSQNTIESPKAGLVGDSMRLRPPRLFANQDGKDLLVEHVEGENVGKALLSRVKLGMYLGEGYIYHSEGVRIDLLASNLNLHGVQDPLIVMITGKRLLVLKDAGNLNFCSTVWEVEFNAIALVEFQQMPTKIGNVTGKVDSMENNELRIWYLARNPASLGAGDEFFNGLDSLRHISMNWMDNEGRQFLSKLLEVEPKLASHSSM